MVNKIVIDKPFKTRIYFLVLSLIATVIGVIVVYGALQVNGVAYSLYSITLLLLGLLFYNKTKNTQ